MNRRYYWVKLQKDFAKDRRVKKLKNIPGGLNFAFIYLEIILCTIDTEGIFFYQGLEDTAAKEIALEIDEDPDNVQITIAYLLSAGLMVDLGDGKFLMPYVTENLGSEGASAKRMRDMRERQKALQDNSNTNKTNTIASQCDTTVTTQLHNGDVDIDIEKEKEKENIKDIKSKKPTLSLGDKTENQSKKQRAPFKKPTVEQLQEYINQKEYTIDAQEFYNYYENNDWFCGKVPMRNWKNAVYAWNKNQKRWSDEKAQKAAAKNSFQQNTYDFDQLEKDLLRN